eukprot:m.169180 g.169180  ORF g.169180 m.169180 type:complete len:708 (-) comp31555_c0_seq2:346-2469(-)
MIMSPTRAAAYYQYSYMYLVVLVFKTHTSLATPKMDCTLTLNPKNVTHRINSNVLGCRSDAGYAHQARGLYAELVYGSAFEVVTDVDPATINASNQINAWSTRGNASAEATSQIPGGTSLVLSANGTATNRGFGNEGLFVIANKVYEGYLVLKSSEPVQVTVTLERRGVPGSDHSPLAQSTLQFAGGNWTKVSFNMTTNEGAACEGITDAEVVSEGIACPVNGTYHPSMGKMSDASAHICVKCGGQFTISMSSTTNTRVNVGFASLMPGAWGRFNNLPVRADSVSMLQQMGITVFRWGGSYVTSVSTPWTHWTGPAWQRPSALNGNWGPGNHPRHAVMSGWGLFEMVDLSNALDATAVLTLNPTVTAPGDLSDFVEYCWGNASTLWGKKRFQDGHPHPYNVTYFELGNEEYNSHFVEQVAGMEARARSIGVAEKFHYLFPSNLGINSSDAVKAYALGLGDRLVVDIHNGAISSPQSMNSVANNPNTKGWGMFNGETNCGDHTVNRLLTEAQSLNLLFNFDNATTASRIKGRTASFCMERSGYNEGGLNDQGISFFLPNMTWLQPPGYVHSMVTSTLQPMGIGYSATECPYYLTPGMYSAQGSEDGKTLVVRFAWTQPTGINMTINVEGALGGGGGGGEDGGGHRNHHTSFSPAARMRVTTLGYPDRTAANTPSNPHKIVPQTLPPTMIGTQVWVPANSYAVFEIMLD